MDTLTFVLVLAAFVAWLLAAFSVPTGRVNMTMLGAALLVLAYLLIPAGQAL